MNFPRQYVQLVKAEHVGIGMMDIIIGGAVPLCNTLLGGNRFFPSLKCQSSEQGASSSPFLKCFAISGSA